MTVAAAVARLHSLFDTAAAMADVAAVCASDRYQASSGIVAAAEYVAARAEEAGLREVRLHHFPADGARRWWTFRAPASWTPVRAELSGPSSLVRDQGPPPAALHASEGFSLPGEWFPLARYPDEPFILAAHSAATGPDGVELPVVRVGAGSLRGALAVHDDPSVPLPLALELAQREGATGIVTDQASANGGVGRVELRGGAPLFAFSLPRGRAAVLVAAGRARVTVDVREDASMPLVTGLIPGEEAGEVLLYAHLCHPMPSANDNATGVAALLAVARMLAGTRPRRSVRFVWGPEFTGMAAYLHDVAGVVPLAAVNVDMAGEDQRLCGGPLIVERAPDHLPGFVSALAEHAAALLPQAARSYTGAVACDTWAWRATPFVGASDHALLADRSIACPAVALGHWPDRFNHSSADTLDKVDPAELRRTTTLAAAIAATLATATPADRPDLESIALRWSADRLLDCLPGGGGTDAGRDRAGGGMGLLRHRTRVAVAAVEWLDVLCGDRGGDRARRWVEGLAGHVASLLPDDAPPARADGPRRARAHRSGPASADGPGLVREWEGPFNLRGLAEDVWREAEEWIGARLAEDRARGYALMVALAHGIDGARDREAVRRYAEAATELPVDEDFARRFLDILLEAGWAAERTIPDGGADAPAHA
ncbi:hypothetical protein Skr01_22450 [Sphaerisporangium krabiense]|uniref:Peptidase M28 domain-containing protein n=1 Tax=Sphaerisporangium krabiense TaxID=763782 RepID=A0A7W9DQY6_9ACTN|nr:DUF4910 domain-containing protein [Sphaerisporangium krabiense]MBB5627996.1 hypothetical protein [Sphaerisporangium krabiense]GII62160.1 hypothetical protein Skr01_22450 [Sphaerisporangium krabiense]